jgi:hypothetical protein
MLFIVERRTSPQYKTGDVKKIKFSLAGCVGRHRGTDIQRGIQIWRDCEEDTQE